MQKRIRHSKFKNTGILFELLTKQVTADIIAGDDNSTAKELLYKYFQENAELGKEWRLYNTLLTEKIKGDTYAERLLNVVISARKRLNFKKLSTEKYHLIKEIKENYPLEELLKSHIKNYKLLASIYKIFEDETSSNYKFDITESFQAKNYIIEHILDKKPKISAEDDVLNYYKNQPEDVRLLSYKLLVEKLNDKYSSKLDEEQRGVLREYICNVANTNKFSGYVVEKIGNVKNSLKSAQEKIDCNVTKIKINEVINQLDKINLGKSSIKDNHVMVLMLSYELLKEIKTQIANV